MDPTTLEAVTFFRRADPEMTAREALARARAEKRAREAGLSFGYEIGHFYPEVRAEIPRAVRPLSLDAIEGSSATAYVCEGEHVLAILEDVPLSIFADWFGREALPLLRQIGAELALAAFERVRVDQTR